MTILFIALLLVAVVVVLSDWRLAPFACTVIALLQDPFRKLAEGKPVWYVVAVGIVFAAALLSALLVRIPLGPSNIRDWRRHLSAPANWFLALIIIQALHGLARFGNPIIPAIGLLTYLSPIPAVLLAYQYAVHQGLEGIHRFLTFYVVCALLALSTVYLEFSGVDWSVFGEVGAGQIIYDKYLGKVLLPYSGIFRASEVAAWHASACACLLLTLLASRGRYSTKRMVVTVVLVILALGVGVVTGRRKIFALIALYAVADISLLLYYGQRSAMKLVAIIATGLVGYMILSGGVNSSAAKIGPVTEYDLFAARSTTVYQDAPQRLLELGILPVTWAYERFGLLGAGIGTGAQGAQHFGGGGADAAAAEGGLGKIMLELGVTGLVLALWLAIALFQHLSKMMKMVPPLSPRLARLAFSLTAFLLANAATFFVATQVYADIFIMLILGMALGFLLAIPTLATRETPTRVGLALGTGDRAPKLLPATGRTT